MIFKKPQIVRKITVIAENRGFSFLFKIAQGFVNVASFVTIERAYHKPLSGFFLLKQRLRRPKSPLYGTI